MISGHVPVSLVQLRQKKKNRAASHIVKVVCKDLKGAYLWMFPNIGVPQYGWFRRENPIKTGDLGVPLFLETPL